MTADFLKDIVSYKQQLIKRKQPFYTSLKQRLGNDKCTRYRLFKKMISAPGKINFIAEIKKASPSKGMFRNDFDILNIARIYTEQKVAAISVLTEDKYFLGHPEYIKKVSNYVNVPVLAKDFIIDEGQIYEARFNGASAILLIVAILDEKNLKSLLNTASSLDLDCLVEVHSEDELKKSLNAGAEIIGVNNRDLRTFEVDVQNCIKIIPGIPKDKIVVAESGIKTRQHILMLKDAGFSAVLAGEIFMREPDIGRKMREIMGE